MARSLPPPRYSAWQAINVAITLGLRALEEVRALAASAAPVEGKPVDRAEIERMIAEAMAGQPPPKRGPEGPAGKLPIAREWCDGVHYEGDVTMYAGATYQAQRDTAREPPHKDWRCLAEAGRDGVDGRSFTVRGTWNEEQEYRALDAVALNGASFVARRDDPGPCPGEGWQLIAAQGKRGAPGERGLKGDRGERGEAGRAIFAAVDDNGLFTLTNADGSSVTCDFYPLLAKVQR